MRKTLKYFFVLVVLALFLPTSAMATQQSHSAGGLSHSSLSGQCYYNTSGTPWYGGGAVYADMSLSCSVNHTRDIQICLQSERTNGTNVVQWNCSESGAYNGKSFYTIVGWSAHYASGYYWRLWWWAYDYSNGETWSGYGPWGYLGVAPG